MNDSKRLRWAVRELTRALACKTKRATDERIERVTHPARPRPWSEDIAFAAVQRLRDLDLLDLDEAIAIWDSMLESIFWDRIGESSHDEGYYRLVTDMEHPELLDAAHRDKDWRIAEPFYRNRGESAVAELYCNDLETYRRMAGEGQYSLLDSKREIIDPEHDEERTATEAEVLERVLSLAATESEWGGSNEEARVEEILYRTKPSVALAAIRAARELGAVTYEQSMALVDFVTDALVHDAVVLDRECHLLDRRMDALVSGEEWDDRSWEEYPAEWHAMNGRLEERTRRLHVVVLRQIGEHRMANLLLENEEKFEETITAVWLGEDAKGG